LILKGFHLRKKQNKPIIQLYNESGIEIPLTQSITEKVGNLVFDSEGVSLQSLEIVFVDEDKIVEINEMHLGRDYVTDIITYHYQDENEPVEGTVFCCAQRIFEQAKELETEPKQEFLRIYIHGLLHLCGYNDTTTEEKLQMTQKENEYLIQIL
jgi:rRNA maturation RNase YbeY